MVLTFFEGAPDDYSSETFLNNIFGADTSIINSYLIYKENSGFRTHLPNKVKANPFGLKKYVRQCKRILF
ncbi:MAG: hypothetical protein H6613_18030 [Ignavibacteriales bacterium]|nr:hypothetical protein [Ignavibacteriales bacterium]